MRITPRHPGKGVWLAQGPEPDLLSTLAAWQGALPRGTGITRLSAAQVHGLWLPRLPNNLPVTVSLERRKGEVVPRHRGIVAIRNATTPPAVEIAGLRVATVAETLLCCSRYLGLLDTVVLIDSALHLERCTVDDLALIMRKRRRGVVQLRLAMEFVDGRSESAWETMLRMLHRVCGIRVTPQVDLVDEQGFFVARVDLVVDQTGQIQEYDGAQHRTADVQARDLARERRLADIGRTRRGYIARDLLVTPELVLHPISTALGRPIHVQPWQDLLDRSLYRGLGRAKLRRTLSPSLTWE